MQKIEKLQSLGFLVKEKIIQYIKDNQLKPHDKLPSENELAAMLGVSRVTIREGLNHLKVEGVIYKAQGKGTFVGRIPIKLKNGLEVLNSVTEIMLNSNYIPLTQYIRREIELPDEEVKNKLKLKDGEKVVTFYRKRFIKGYDELAVYSVNIIPVGYFHGDIPEILPEESMLEFFAKQLDQHIVSAHTQLIPYTFDSKMSKYLGVNKDIIFLLFDQIFYNFLGQEAIYSLDYFNSNFFNFTINRHIISDPQD
jgi:GntR family transcriptional regulator